MTVALRCKRVAVAVADPPNRADRGAQKNGSVQGRADNPCHTRRSRLENRPALRTDAHILGQLITFLERTMRQLLHRAHAGGTRNLGAACSRIDKRLDAHAQRSHRGPGYHPAGDLVPWLVENSKRSRDPAGRLRLPERDFHHGTLFVFRQDFRHRSLARSLERFWLTPGPRRTSRRLPVVGLRTRRIASS